MESSTCAPPSRSRTHTTLTKNQPNRHRPAKAPTRNESQVDSVTALYWAVTASGVVCAKIVEISALTSLERADPTFWVTLRAKWNRHRSHPALGRIALIENFSPR